ncbi:unnamed protein product [Knipowitschia caucasica]
METCLDEALGAPDSASAAVTSELPEEGAVGGDQPLSLSEAAARLKELELETASVSLTPKNVNLNVAMNNQELVKLTEKVVLSPLRTPDTVRTPDNLKSNILKAQAEAQAVKVCVPPTSVEDQTVTDKNCHLQETPSVERVAEDLCVPMELSIETLLPQVCPEGVQLSVSENLIDFTDTAALAPQVAPVQIKTVLTPRWIIPASAPPGIFSNGLEPECKSAPLCAEAAVTRSNNNSSASPAEEESKPRGLLTTEL